MIAVLLFGGINASEAKTKSKKKIRTTTTTSSSHDGASFLYSSTFIGDEGFYSTSLIVDDLIEAGFKLQSSTKKRIAYGECYVTATKSVYNGGNATVSLWVYDGYTIEADIKFSRSSDLNSFIERMEDAGWEYSYSNRGTKVYDRDGGSMYVEGLNVVLTIGG